MDWATEHVVQSVNQTNVRAQSYSCYMNNISYMFTLLLAIMLGVVTLLTKIQYSFFTLALFSWSSGGSYNFSGSQKSSNLIPLGSHSSHFGHSKGKKKMHFITTAIAPRRVLMGPWDSNSSSTFLNCKGHNVGSPTMPKNAAHNAGSTKIVPSTPKSRKTERRSMYKLNSKMPLLVIKALTINIEIIRRMTASLIPILLILCSGISLFYSFNELWDWFGIN